MKIHQYAPSPIDRIARYAAVCPEHNETVTFEVSLLDQMYGFGLGMMERRATEEIAKKCPGCLLDAAKNKE